ncbi:MAG: hypothetical protein FJW27_04435 [Acidimicrobiia bacterium]|nr:hypothetical protein [Acidimicrobiia bacterium]
MQNALRSSVTVLLTAIGSMATVAQAQDLHLAGRYRAEGTNPDGKPYRSIVDIEQEGETYLVRWLEREGRAVGVGIGIVRDNFLSVSYLSGRQLGVVVYRIEKGPVLTGQWTVLGADGSLWPESLSKAGVAAELDTDEVDTLAEVELERSR